jgi:starvation-inducible DNA-binding protein
MKNQVAQSINKYLANVGVNYIKLHNLHWNVIGKDFKPVHEYLESLYDSFAEVLDEVAELLKMHDQVPAASMKEYLALADIEEFGAKEVYSSEVLQIVLADLQLLKAQAEAIRAEAEDDYSVVAMMEDHLANYNKSIWFVKSMLK